MNGIVKTGIVAVAGSVALGTVGVVIASTANADDDPALKREDTSSSWVTPALDDNDDNDDDSPTTNTANTKNSSPTTNTKNTTDTENTKNTGPTANTKNTGPTDNTGATDGQG